MIRAHAKAKEWQGAVHVFPDGRERCNETPEGKAEYHRRRLEMRERQGECCCLCGQWMSEYEASFEHENGRGGGKRDDRIYIDGKRYNGSSHSICNQNRGSKRTPFVLQ